MQNNVSILDVISISAQRDAIVVLPTLRHAIHWWPRIIVAAKDKHGSKAITTRTAIVFHDTKTLVRLWVPYGREPTMPMDIARDRPGRELLNLYSLYRGGLI